MTTELVDKNVLNEIRANNMTLQELRFFSIYLSKIKSGDTNTRLVRFSLKDFQKIMELEKLNISYLDAVEGLLCKIIHRPIASGGFMAFQIFKCCTVIRDSKTRDWYVEIDSHDEALPLMFEFKDKYFSYQLWNALRLKNSNQLRIYEILKQYEKVGELIISVDELKSSLGINEGKYPHWDMFKELVLDACKKAIEENTDLKFTYEPTEKKDTGGKIIKLKFKIYQNKNFRDPLMLDEFIDSKDILIDINSLT